jgi:signal peptidase I
LATPGRSDVPSRYRNDFERAGGLLEEAERIKDRFRRQLTRDLTAGEREDLDATLDLLRASMKVVPFDGERFEQTLQKAETDVDMRLGRFRKGELREYAESIGIAVAVALLLRVFLVEAFKIPSGSMIPTLQVGDHIFVNKLTFGPLVPWLRARLFSRMPPRRGDVIVFEFPENREQDFIKRVIALPGDRLEVKDGHPILNGWRVPSCPVGTYTYRESDSAIQRKADLVVEYLEDRAYLTLYERTFLSGSGELQGPYTAKPGEVWVMGDNRNNSHDSRGWFEGRGGGVPFANIKGRALFVWLSFDATGKMAWERILVDVMGKPRLPPELEPSLGAGVEKCFRDRPPLSETTPPAPR